MKTFYIASLKCAPGNWQHINSFARCLLSRGYQVRLLLSKGYEWMNEDYAAVTDYLTRGSGALSLGWDVIAFILYKWLLFVYLFWKYKPSAILLVMWHPMNFALALIAKLVQPDVKVLSWVAEPYKDDKRLYGRKAIAISGIEFVQSLSFFLTDVVILHSQRALRLFQQKYPWYKGLIKKIPPLWKDEAVLDLPREYVTFLGRATREKGIDLFLEVARTSYEKGLGHKFQIVTSYDIGEYLQRLPAGILGTLRVVARPQLSDQEIRAAAGSSFAVWAVYKSVMQSGVVPIALMNGTPVICTPLEGLTEFVSDGLTARFVPNEPSCDDVLQAIAYVKANFDRMSKECRRSYLKQFDDSAWDNYYAWLGTLIGA